MAAYSKSDIERRMAGAIEALKQDLVGLRTGRASIAAASIAAGSIAPAFASPASARATRAISSCAP